MASPSMSMGGGMLPVGAKHMHVAITSPMTGMKVTGTSVTVHVRVTGYKDTCALAGRPLMQWSIDALRQAPSVERIVVALPPGLQAPDGVTAVAGGAARSQSVRRALAAAGDAEMVLVHDAARPLLTAQIAVTTEESAGGSSSLEEGFSTTPSQSPQTEHQTTTALRGPPRSR